MPHHLKGCLFLLWPSNRKSLFSPPSLRWDEIWIVLPIQNKLHFWKSITPPRLVLKYMFSASKHFINSNQEKRVHRYSLAMTGSSLMYISSFFLLLFLGLNFWDSSGNHPFLSQGCWDHIRCHTLWIFGTTTILSRLHGAKRERQCSQYGSRLLKALKCAYSKTFIFIAF